MTEKKIELLAPAGNPEKCRTAIHYGADAVYLSGNVHSLRSYAGNFSLDEMNNAISQAHEAGVRVYVAVNAFVQPPEMASVRSYLEALKEIRPDALIIADPGVIWLARQIVPEIPVHLSTQANTTNQYSVRFWEGFGIRRINAARELSLEDIQEITGTEGPEVEAFVHGSMCIAYSGRCLLSSFMTQRHSNQGHCAHPCRWRYSVVEELRPGEYMPLVEDGKGSYIFNSKDLCMIGHLPEMIESGIASLKIEGRQKGLNYLATTVKIYRSAIDAYYQSPSAYRIRDEWKNELARIRQRPYCTGFYLNDPAAVLSDFENRAVTPACRFAGIIRAISDTNQLRLSVRNRIEVGDTIDILTQTETPAILGVREIQTVAGKRLQKAQAGMEVLIPGGSLNHLRPNDIVRTITSSHAL